MARTVLSSGLITGLTGLLAITAFGLTACGGGGGGGSESRVVTDFSACDKMPDVGASAISENSTKTEFVVSDFFEKPFDRFDLEAVLDASSTSTTAYVRSLGIGLYKIPRTKMAGQCPTYFNLPLAPKPFQSIWSQASSGNTGNGQLAGLFFEFCGDGTGAGCRPRDMVQPTILVDEASDRWTLVHEMMHYNFNQTRKGIPEIRTNFEIERALSAASKRFQKAMGDFKTLPNQGDLFQASEALREVAELTREVAVRRPLEEVSIEGLLIDLWAKGEFKNVSAHAPSSGVWYMTYSRDQFFNLLPPLEQSVAEIKALAEENVWDATLKDATETEDLLASMRHEVDTKIEEAKRKIKKVQKWVDEEHFNNAKGRVSLADGGDEATFDAAKAEERAKEEALNHLKMHDADGLQQKLEDTLREMANSL